MIMPFLYVAPSKNKGRGVFTSDPIAKGSLIEVSPVIVMSGEERKLLDQTLLHDYIFEWGYEKDKCCMALGYVPVYNHSSKANCDYEMDYESEIIIIKTLRDISGGEELTINYNGIWNDKKPVWFEEE